MRKKMHRFLILFLLIIGISFSCNNALNEKNHSIEGKEITDRRQKIWSKINELRNKLEESKESKMQIGFVQGIQRKDSLKKAEQERHRLLLESLKANDVDISKSKKELDSLTIVRKEKKYHALIENEKRKFKSDMASLSQIRSKLLELDIGKKIDKDIFRANLVKISPYAHYFRDNNIELPILDTTISDYSSARTEILNKFDILLNADVQQKLENEIIKKGNKLEVEIDKNIDSLRNEIAKLIKKRNDSKVKLEKCKKKIDSLKAEIEGLKKRKKEHLELVENAIKELEIEISKEFAKLVSTLLEPLTYVPPELKQKKAELFEFENKILNLARNGKYGAAFKLIQKIDDKLSDLDNLIKKTNRKNYVFSKLYKGDPFFVHFNLGDSVNFAGIEPAGRYNKSFLLQLNILKSFISYFPTAKIYIDGHADRIEYRNRSYYSNVQLSKGRQQRIINILSNKLIVTDSTIVIADWFSKYVNKVKLSNDRALVDQDSGGVSDRRVEIRIEQPFKEDEILPNALKKYLSFKNSLTILLSKKESKTFKHEQGFWIEHGYEQNNNDEIGICYMSEAYKTLLRNSTCSILAKKWNMEEIRKKKSDDKMYPKILNVPDYITRFELGSQVKFLLKIAGRVYRININQNGEKRINNIEDERFRNYLNSLRPKA